MPCAPQKLLSGRWRGVVITKTQDGRRQYLRQTFDYQYEAEEWSRQTELRLAVAGDRAAGPESDGPRPEPRIEQPRSRRAPTLADHADEWLRRRSGSVSGATAKNYGRGVRALKGGTLGKARLDTIHRSDVEDWWVDLLDDDVTPSGRTLRLKVLRMVYRDAIENELVYRDPSAALRMPTVDIRAERVLTRAEDARLLLAAPDDRAKAFILLGLDAGLRWGEIAGLACCDVDVERKLLTIRQVVERDSGELRGYPKSHRARVVPIGTDRLFAAVETVRAAALDARGPVGLVTVNGAGRQIDYDNWRRDMWYPTRGAAGMADPQPRFHDLRHTYGTRLADAGVPRKEIALLLGHADERTTARYIHGTDHDTRLRMVQAALG